MHVTWYYTNTLLYFTLLFIVTITKLLLATGTTIGSYRTRLGRPSNEKNGTRLFHYPFLATRIPSVVGLDP